MLHDTSIPVAPGDERRLDIVAPGLNVHRGLPLFCDVTVISPLTGSGEPRGGTSNRGGRLLEEAQADNDETYRVVIDSGLGSLQCLGCEVFGRWSEQCIELVPALARERTRGLHPRVRRGIALALQHRWWGLLGVSLQKSVAQLVLNPNTGVGLVQTQLEPAPCLADIATSS